MSPSPKTGVDWSTPRRFAPLAFFALAILASQVSFRIIGGYLYLIYTYGFSRVQSEHLHLLKMGKGVSWIVSNGDKIPGGGFPWFLLVTAITFALFIPTYLLVYRLLPKKKDGA
jgi:hypothetical protein